MPTWGNSEVVEFLTVQRDLYGYLHDQTLRMLNQGLGGADAVVEKAQGSFDSGDLRWVAEVLSHVVFATPEHAGARELLAATYQQLGYGSENGTWRNFYLSGATELRHGSFGTPTVTTSPDIVANLPAEMLFDALAIRIDGPRAWDLELSIEVHPTDDDAHYWLRLRNGVLTYSSAGHDGPADVSLTGPRAALPVLATGSLESAALRDAGLEVSGDDATLERLASVLDDPDSDFAIVTAEKE